MMKDRLYLSPPSMGDKELINVHNAVKSNWVATVGSYISQFEKDLEVYLGSDKYVVALNSGTSAIHIGLLLLGVTKGDEVLVQSHTHIASVNPVLYLGATPIFIDSEEDTWNMCPIYLEKAIQDRIKKGKKPKAIIVVDLYGMPYKVDAIKKLSKAYNIPVLEDAAEALGSTYKGKKCGTFGDVGVISFNGNKIITTSGGGALIVNSREAKEKAIYLANQAKEDVPYFEHKTLGYNYRMTNVAASIGCAQLEKIDQLLTIRKQNNQLYRSIFENQSNIQIQQNYTDDLDTNYWLTVVLATNLNQNEKFRLYLEQFNIESRRLWKPMHLQSLYKQQSFYGTTVAENLFEKGLCLPSGMNLNNENKMFFRKIMSDFFT